jgi:hypothetical protein
MVTAGDPVRNPTFVLFADPNYFITDFPASTCETCINPAFAWNHGDIQKEIAQTWLGLVGPGVRSHGVSHVWTDHADVRPTMLTLLGLSDAYGHDGRTISEALHEWALPRSLREHQGSLERLGAVYKQVNAPFGRFAMHLLKASTAALASGSASDDGTYAALQSRIADLTAQRDALASSMKAMLDAAAFGNRPIDERRAHQLIEQGEELLRRAASE